MFYWVIMFTKRPLDLSSITPLMLFYIIAAILFLVGPIQIGFISDDFDLISRASHTNWFYPLETHHWSPVISTLFKATSEGLIGRTSWCVLAFLAHCANISLVWEILVRRLNVYRFQAWAITLLFTLCPAGFEAITWSCAIGYPLVTFIILLGFYFICCEELGHNFKYLSIILGLLQVIALQIWDWGILLSPILFFCFVSHFLTAENKKIACFRWAKILFPSCLCLIVFLVTKKLAGQSYGYTLHLDMISSIRTLVTTPLWGIYPDGSADFYKSPLKHVVTFCIILFFCYASIKDSRIRLFIMIFFICQLPYILFSTPESRYFYIGSFFLYSAIVLSIGLINIALLRVGLTVILISLSTQMSFNRALLWKGAYQESNLIRISIDNLSAQARSRQVVVVNLPDRYGPKGMIWRPFMWRNGLSVFKESIARVNTNDAPFTWPEIWIPVLNRTEVFIKYPNLPVFEVAYNDVDSWSKFKVYKLENTAETEGTKPDGKL